MTTAPAADDPRGLASVLPARPGVPWWVAVLVALIPTVLGFAIDLARVNTVGVIAWVLTLAGVLGAAALVRRHALFTAMVQPPLVVAGGLIFGFLAAYVFGAVGGGVLQLGLKLVSTFPLMLAATAVGLLAGLYRLYTQPLRRTGPRTPRNTASHA